MTTANSPHNQFPSPYRAPGPAPQVTHWQDDSELAWTDGPDGRRYQRAIDGWIAGRIRKQSRHWRRR